MLNKIVKVNQKGQITIPKSIREKEGICPMDMVKVSYVPSMIFVDKITREPDFRDIVDFFSSSGLGKKDWKRIQEEREESER